MSTIKNHLAALDPRKWREPEARDKALRVAGVASLITMIVLASIVIHNAKKIQGVSDQIRSIDSGEWFKNRSFVDYFNVWQLRDGLVHQLNVLNAKHVTLALFTALTGCFGFAAVTRSGSQTPGQSNAT